MQYTYQVLPWYRSGLFWRTFFLLSLLMTASMTVWFASFKVVERKPRAQQVSAQIVSIVTLTRAALTHAAADKRRQLLVDLASNEGIQIYLLEDDDRIIEPDTNAFFQELSVRVRQKLGVETRFAREVNDESGFWVSFVIDADHYWLRLDSDRIQDETGLQILGWASITLILTLIGAIFISKFVNNPLSQLSAAARELANGRTPQALPEEGPREIRETNLSFNQMVTDLARIEQDRALILAGISHDLRTPITRMQLEVEMASLDDAARTGMQSDLAQMDSIINQFLDYAKPFEDHTVVAFDISEICKQAIVQYARNEDTEISFDLESELLMNGLEIEIRRCIVNLFENARRYGRSLNDDKLRLHITGKKVFLDEQSRIILSIRDFGPGVPASELMRMLQPFTRLDIARGQANGSGLGLAIVDRIVKRHSGKINIENHRDGGLDITLSFPPAR
ncbi:ATP-binding protein [Undibacterium cyanobacteriorum]|uniref:histidine kinase n=1 Tax=Undibacterium cyanobacteriorum TaxID=3073561 RepID=A0ABY9RFL8_9BURK|nr:ATP-binding protein [Undibacterium sp. 20NA77.5]WMW78941.1 ATP-binding protein [Undibacterium sp. 20NA77.5]